MEEIEKLKSKGQLNKPVKISGQEVLDIVNEREDLTAKIATLEKKIGGLEGKVKDAESKSGSFAADKAGLEGAMGDITKEVENARAQVAQYSQALTAAQDLISSREEEMNKLTVEVENLRRQVGGMSGMDQQIASLQGQVGQLQAKDREIASLREVVESSQAELARAGSSQTVINQLNQQLAQMQADLNSRPSATEVEKRDQQIMNLTSQAKTLNSTIAQLKEEVRSKDTRIKELSEPQAVFAPSIVSKATTTPAFTPPPPEPVMAHHPHPTPIEPAPEPPAPVPTPTAPMPSTGGSGRRVCPNCGSSQIKEMEDRTRIVSYIPKPMYAKKFVCRKCSYEFT